MALRLGDLVECGELLNTRKHCVHGWLKLQGQESPLRLQLTGNCSPDLRGWHIRFEAREPEPDDPSRPMLSDEEVESKLAGIAWEQVGPPGTMTAAHKVKVTKCSPRELYMRCKAGEPPPFEWKPCLYLEWYSQNGRVVIEMADPILDYVEFVDLGDVSACDPPPEAQSPEEEQAPPTLGITAIQLDEEGNADIREYRVSPAQDDEDEPPDDPYVLFSGELQQHLDRQARDTDRAVSGDDDSDVIRELELMDDLIDHGQAQPLQTFLRKPGEYPPADQLDDRQVEIAFHSLLGELALFGIALDMCEHFTPRDAYRLLVEKICPKEEAFRELRGTQWVQHFMTSEYCDQCAAKFEREWEERERRGEQSPGEPPPNDQPALDDDIPF